MDDGKGRAHTRPIPHPGLLDVPSHILLMPSAHEQLLILDSLAQRPGLHRGEVDILQGFARTLWKAHLDAPNTWWLWPFTAQCPRTYVTAEGWDAQAVLHAFARIDPQILRDGNLNPTAHSYAVPVLTKKAIQEVCGLDTEGQWQRNMMVRSFGFSFRLPE